jgi:hypothetical protein
MIALSRGMTGNYLKAGKNQSPTSYSSCSAQG